MAFGCVTRLPSFSPTGPLSQGAGIFLGLKMKKLIYFIAALGLFLFPQIAQSANLAATPETAPTYNFSTAIATGNTFQTILPAAVGRRSLTIQNNNATDGCWISFGSIAGVTITAGNAAKASSISLAAGQAFTRYYPFIPSDEIEGTCATSADTLYIDTQ
jgi:hypothetical protein